jgi:hypothetical protein
VLKFPLMMLTYSNTRKVCEQNARSAIHVLASWKVNKFYENTIYTDEPQWYWTFVSWIPRSRIFYFLKAVTPILDHCEQEIRQKAVVYKCLMAAFSPLYSYVVWSAIISTLAKEGSHLMTLLYLFITVLFCC